MSTWQVQEAKARFSELMRGADETGPQTITVRGRRKGRALVCGGLRPSPQPKALVGRVHASFAAGGYPAHHRPQPFAAARYRPVSFLVDTCALSELIKPRPSNNVCEWFDATPPEALF